MPYIRDADRCVVCGELALLSASTPHDLPLSRSFLLPPGRCVATLYALSTRSTPFDPAAAWRSSCLTSPHERALCLRMARRKGWRRKTQKPKRAEPLRAAVAADLNGAARSSGSQAESYSTIISYCMIQCEFGEESFCLTATRLDVD